MEQQNWGQSPQPGAGHNPYQAPARGGYAEDVGVANPDLKTILFSFQGRASRTHYWLGSLGMALTVGVIAVAATLILGEDAGAIFVLLSYIPAIWIGTALSVKRWHDRGKSGLWIFIGLVPIVGSIWTLVECGLLEGTPGPNQYGPPVT